VVRTIDVCSTIYACGGGCDGSGDDFYSTEFPSRVVTLRHCLGFRQSPRDYDAEFAELASERSAPLLVGVLVSVRLAR